MADAKEETQAEETQGEDTKAEENAEEEAKAEESKDVDMKEDSKEAESPKEPEKPKELEQDAAEEVRPKVGAEAVDISTTDATLNVMPTAENRLLMTLTEGGFQYLLAGVRTTVGLKSGRYMFEVKIVETPMHGEPDRGNQGRSGPMPKHLVRLGVSTAGSSLFLADGNSTSVSVDSEGFMVFEKTRKKVAQKFGRDTTVAMLINLDEASPNANTISLFRDGTRICEPQVIPEKLRGKPLFPHITYKNVTLQVNLGPNPIVPLPFKCHMLSSAASADVEVAEVRESKCEVVFPVGLPDKGYFDWVDSFLEQNPGFEELSDRKMLEWAVKSGLARPKAGGSTDKPEMKFGIRELDDGSVRRLLGHVAPTAKRSFIIPELKANLTESERKEALLKFASPEFKKTAMVLLGEPSDEYKAKVQEFLLAEKRSKAEAEAKKKQAEEERKRLVEERKKKAEEARKAREAAKKKKDGAEEEDEVKEEKEEEKEEETNKETKVEDIVVELTEEEKGLWCRPTTRPDITETLLARSYAEFSVPLKEEGFDEVKFQWQGEAESAKLLKEWIFAKKLTQRVEDLTPGESFKPAWSEWQKTLQAWRKLRSEWKDPAKKKALLAKRAEAKKTEAEEKGEEAPKDMEIDMEELDVFAVEDVVDVGNGEPLFANFEYEDWVLLSARYELHLLLHSFKKDLNDPDRPSFTEKDLAFYYNKYFKKTFALKNFAVDKLAGLVEHIKDTFTVNDKTSFLEPVLAEDTPTSNFVKLAEDHRRERQRRLDAGDETAEIKFPRGAPAPPPRQPPSHHGAGARGAAVGSRAPPSSYQQQRHGSSYSGGGGSYGQHGSSRPAYGSSAPKRAYTPSGGSSQYGSSAKQSRTSYSSSGYGGGYSGGYGRR